MSEDDLARAIEGLPEDEKLVITLLHYERLELSEAARATGVAIEEMAAAYERAMQSFGSALLADRPTPWSHRAAETKRLSELGGDALYPPFRTGISTYFKDGFASGTRPDHASRDWRRPCAD